MSTLRLTYQLLARRRILKLSISILVLLILIGVAGSLGVNNVSIFQVLSIILDTWIADWNTPVNELDRTIVLHLRLPRVALGLVAGAALAIAGVVMQGIMRNPLVSPFTVGISPAASFGATVAVLTGWEALPGGHYIVVLCAFISAMVCASLVLSISTIRGSQSTTLILVGIALTYFFAALTNAGQFIATEEDLSIIVHWTFGSLNRSTWDHVIFVLTIICITLPFLIRYAWCYNALNQGEEVATSLGYNVKKTRIVTIILAVLLSAGVVSFTGVIGFIGLVAPHISRYIIGTDHRFLIPFSAVVGAILLVAADTLGRTALSPVIIPVGIVVAFIGVPMFVHLILTKKQDYFS